MQQDDLAATRREIDAVDEQIVLLLNRRAGLAKRVGVAKNATSRATYAPDREHEVLARVKAAGAPGPMTSTQLTSIYRQIISACRALEWPLRVAYLGPAQSFTHQASIERFGDATEFVPVATIADIFSEVQRGGAEFGVVPVENSTQGPVGESLDLFVDSELKVCSEIVIPISMNLLSRSARSAVQKIYSNPVALAQCRQWLAKNLPAVEIVTVESTSRAAAMAAEDPTSAAIANTLAATEYGLAVVDAEIQDLAANYTRFYVIAPAAQGAGDAVPRSINQPTGNDKSAVIFSIRDRVGALRDAADVFAQRRINMSSIQSRPSRRRVWDYLFFVEFSGHEADPPVQEALAELQQQCVFVKLIGSWPVDDVGS